MSPNKINTLIIGGGQAGIAMSEHLSNSNVSHLVLEKNRIAEAWRTSRWDSLVANGPAWHDRFPSLTFAGFDPDEFIPKEKVADYFVAYADHINAPIRTGVTVEKVKRKTGQSGFYVQTSEGNFEAENIVAATGPFQRPTIPPIIKEDTSVLQIHSNAYRNPQQLPDGGVLVIGAGSSGAQIADELMRSGKKVYLSVGPHDRPPRSYRGRDFVWWLGVLGKWDASAMEPGKEHVTIAVSGAYGGMTVNFRRFAQEGMTLVGMTASFKDGIMHFENDLAGNISDGDANYLSVLKEADIYIRENGLDLPEEPEAHDVGPEPACVTNPIHKLDLEAENVSSIIWATGYKTDYAWLDVDTFDERDQPIHQRGVSNEAGVYFLGLPWQSRRGSSFIWGVWHDAKYIADQICKQRSYIDYHNSSIEGETHKSKKVVRPLKTAGGNS